MSDVNDTQGKPASASNETAFCLKARARRYFVRLPFATSPTGFAPGIAMEDGQTDLLLRIRVGNRRIDPVLNGTSKIEDAMKAGHGELYLLEVKFHCDRKYDARAVAALKGVRPDFIEVGYDTAPSGTKCGAMRAMFTNNADERLVLSRRKRHLSVHSS